MLIDELDDLWFFWWCDHIDIIVKMYFLILIQLNCIYSKIKN